MGSTAYDWSPLFQGLQGAIQQWGQQRQYKQTLDALLGPQGQPPIQPQSDQGMIPRLLMHLGIGGQPQTGDLGVPIDPGMSAGPQGDNSGFPTGTTSQVDDQGHTTWHVPTNTDPVALLEQYKARQALPFGGGGSYANGTPPTVPNLPPSAPIPNSVEGPGGFTGVPPRSASPMGGISPQLAQMLRTLPPSVGLPLLMQQLKPKEDEFASTRDGQIYNKRTGQLMGTSVVQRDKAAADAANAQQAATIAGTDATGDIGALDSLQLDPGTRESLRSLVLTGGKQGLETYNNIVKSLAEKGGAPTGGITTKEVETGGEKRIGQFDHNGNLVGWVKDPEGKIVTTSRFKPDAPAEQVLPGDATLDPDSNSILAQTGLSLPAYMALTGQASKLPRDKASRQAAFNEAQKFANKQGVDVSTLTSQFQALNETLGSNIKRVNQTKIMEDELQGTIENLKPVADAAGAGRLRIANVAKLWAGEQVNDPIVNQYAFQLNQLKSELAAYNGAVQGRTGPSLTQQDYNEAERVIKNGLSSGGAAGLSTAVTNATGKMNEVLNRSVDSARKGVWDLFGVGKNYKPKYAPAGAPKGGGNSILDHADAILKGGR